MSDHSRSLSRPGLLHGSECAMLSSVVETILMLFVTEGIPVGGKIIYLLHMQIKAGRGRTCFQNDLNATAWQRFNTVVQLWNSFVAT